ncbi:MAG TPA: hypothetical protein VGK52_04505 [Polyangia bacterium]|jgi:hypothetical protein
MPPRAKARRWRRWLPVSFALALTLSFGTADAWAKGNPPARAATEAPASLETRTQAPPPAPEPAFDDLYVEREVSAAGLEAFRGGDVVIIGSTGLIILLLVILIILLL